MEENRPNEPWQAVAGRHLAEMRRKDSEEPGWRSRENAKLRGRREAVPNVTEPSKVSSFLWGFFMVLLVTGMIFSFFYMAEITSP